MNPYNEVFLQLHHFNDSDPTAIVEGSFLPKQLVHRDPSKSWTMDDQLDPQFLSSPMIDNNAIIPICLFSDQSSTALTKRSSLTSPNFGDQHGLIYRHVKQGKIENEFLPIETPYDGTTFKYLRWSCNSSGRMAFSWMTNSNTLTLALFEQGQLTLQTWPAQFDNSSSGGGEYSYHDLALNDRGDLALAWCSADESKAYYQLRSQGQWINVSQILNLPGQSCKNIAVTLNDQTQALVSWGGSSKIYVAECDHNTCSQESSNSQTLSTSFGSNDFDNSNPIHLGLSENGDAMVLWGHNGGMLWAERKNNAWVVHDQNDDSLTGLSLVAEVSKQFVMNREGRGFLVWKDPYQHLLVRGFQNGAWEDLTQVTTLNPFASSVLMYQTDYFDVDVSDGGDALVSWIDQVNVGTPSQTIFSRVAEFK
ncbi:MAG: hypothetical protein R3A11_08910 [Bdellovibrionota bacterium]